MLSSLHVALFKNPNDSELALFQACGVHAELQCVIHSLELPQSHILKLVFSSLYLSKYIFLKYQVVGDELMATLWLKCLLKGMSEATITQVPEMNDSCLTHPLRRQNVILSFRCLQSYIN